MILSVFLMHITSRFIRFVLAMGIRFATLLACLVLAAVLQPYPVSAQSSRDSVRVDRSSRARGSNRGEARAAGRSEKRREAARTESNSRERPRVEVRDRTSRSTGSRSSTGSSDRTRGAARTRSSARGRVETGTRSDRTQGRSGAARETARTRDNAARTRDNAARTRNDAGHTRDNDRNRRDDRYDNQRNLRDDDRGRRDDNNRHYGNDRRYDNDRRYGNSRRYDDWRPPAHIPPRFRSRVRPFIHIDISWPWVHRRERRWSPLYRYRQVVDIDAGWGRHHQTSRVDVRTYYRHRIRNASSVRAQVDVFIERIEIYDNGYFVGEVRNIPGDLARVRATMYRRGGADFDRDLFIVGDPYDGFELISTRHYGGFVLDRYDRAHGYRAGVLDFRHERVVPVRRSRFFDPYDFSGYVPIGLLPRDDAWFGDYGSRAPSRYWYGDDDQYFYGLSGDSYGYDDGRTDYRTVEPHGGTDAYSGRALPDVSPLERSDDDVFRTERGAEIRVKRETFLERIE